MLGQKGRNLAKRHWLGNQIALHDVATQLPQHIKLIRTVYAFGKDKLAQIMRESGDRSDNRVAVLVMSEVDDERSVDLNRLDWQGLDMRERGVARSKIVERNRHAVIP